MPESLSLLRRVCHSAAAPAWLLLVSTAGSAFPGQGSRGKQLPATTKARECFIPWPVVRDSVPGQQNISASWRGFMEVLRHPHSSQNHRMS